MFMRLVGHCDDSDGEKIVGALPGLDVLHALKLPDLFILAQTLPITDLRFDTMSKLLS